MTNQAGGELILYRTEDGRTQIQLRAAGGTAWLTQAEIAELFGTQTPNISKHIAAVLEEGEQDRSTISSQEVVRREGTRTVRRSVHVHNLDMILAIGYRVRSPRAISSGRRLARNRDSP